MSSGDYLRNKMASSRQLIYVRKPTDASMVTQKKRFSASSEFLLSGGKGSLRSATDGGNLAKHIIGSTFKLTGVGADASVFTSYKGGQAISDDAPFRAGGFKSPPCNPSSVNILNFNNASSWTSSLKNCPINRGDTEKPTAFVDNTIRLNSGVPSLFSSPTSSQTIPSQCLTTAYHGPKNIVRIYNPKVDYSRVVNKPWIGTPYVDGMLPFNTTSLKLGGPTPWKKLTILEQMPASRGNPNIGHICRYTGRVISNVPIGLVNRVNKPTLFNIKF